MKRFLRTTVALCAVGLLGAYAIAQIDVPQGMPRQRQATEAAEQAGMRQRDMHGDMAGMMAKMPPEVMLRCRMLMKTAVSSGDPAAMMALNEELKLTEPQVTQLEAIIKDAREKAAVVLTADQKKTLDTMPQSPQTMKDMHEQMLRRMQGMMENKRGDQPMSCPLMQMMNGQTRPTTQPQTDAPVEPEHGVLH